MYSLHLNQKNLILLAFFFLLIISCSPENVNESGDISGITIVENAGVKTSRVYLYSTQNLNQAIDSTISDSLGRYHFYNVPYGHYVVRALLDSLLGNSPQEVHLQSSQVSTINITIKKASDINVSIPVLPQGIQIQKVLSFGQEVAFDSLIHLKVNPTDFNPITILTQNNTYLIYILDYKNNQYILIDYNTYHQNTTSSATLSSSTTVSIQCDTLQPDSTAGQDAFVEYLSTTLDANFGSNPQLTINAWTHSGEFSIIHGYIQFDFSKIPTSKTITKAELTLYAWDDATGSGPHSIQSGSNEAWIQRVTSPWDQKTITWNNQPSVTSTNRITLPEMATAGQNLPDLNVLPLVNDMIGTGKNNYGFEIELKTEQYYRNLNFASSNHLDASKHPKLHICYQ